MSRVAKQPVMVPKDVNVALEKANITVKGKKGQMQMALHKSVSVEQVDGALQCAAKNATQEANAIAGTTRAILQNMVTGVTDGFRKKLDLVGVGYRAQAQGKVLNLTLGFSHPVAYAVPEGITIETPSQTEILINGIDKQKVGQVAAEIRAYRPPEPYKGKGVKYSDEVVVRKEAKKK